MSEKIPQGSEQNQQIQAQVMLSNKKSMGVGLLLTLLFGPLGMIYATVIGAIVMFIVSLIAAFATLGIGLLITWPIQLIWTYLSIKIKNDSIDRKVLSS